MFATILINVFPSWLSAAIVCLIVSSSITMSVPFALGKILDIIFDKEGADGEQALVKLKHFSSILLAVFVVGGLANFGRVYLFNSACEIVFIL